MCLNRKSFRAHRTNDLTKKLEKVGPFECDELEKHCRVSAKSYPTKLSAMYTIANEKINKKWKTEFEMLRSCKKFKLNIRIRRSRCIFLYFYCLKIYFLRILNISKNIVVLELFREQNTAPLPNLTRLESGEALGSDIASFAPWVCGLRRAIAFQGDWDQLHGPRGEKGGRGGGRGC